jgi:hypothetical protein
MRLALILLTSVILALSGTATAAGKCPAYDLALSGAEQELPALC